MVTRPIYFLRVVIIGGYSFIPMREGGGGAVGRVVTPLPRHSIYFNWWGKTNEFKGRQLEWEGVKGQKRKGIYRDQNHRAKMFLIVSTLPL